MKCNDNDGFQIRCVKELKEWLNNFDDEDIVCVSSNFSDNEEIFEDGESIGIYDIKCEKMYYFGTMGFEATCSKCGKKL